MICFESFSPPFYSLSRRSPHFYHLFLYDFNLKKNKQLFKLFFTGTYYYLDKPAPIPKFSLHEFVDPQYVEYLKATGFNNYNKAMNLSTDYWFYLKGIAHNTATEAKKLWSENFKY